MSGPSNQLALDRYFELTDHRETNFNALWHHVIHFYGLPCAGCGKPLRTPAAKWCPACGTHVGQEPDGASAVVPESASEAAPSSAGVRGLRCPNRSMVTTMVREALRKLIRCRSKEDDAVSVTSPFTPAQPLQCPTSPHRPPDRQGSPLRRIGRVAKSSWPEPRSVWASSRPSERSCR